MESDIGFPLVIVSVIIGFGLLINAGFNQEIRQRECRMELATQTKLDTANIAVICK